ncbi:MAG: hypothetical protein JXR64_05230 [Spirochaetales bacterium]|nr:hypothetical protein [Spirochaetales bacterium]
MIKDYIVIISVISILTFIGSIIIIPLLIINLSPDYFIKKHQPMYNYKHPVIRYIVLLLKNILGFILILLGIIMLFIPGQGLLSIGFGVLLINFPGKKKLEYKIFTNKKISSVINKLRKKAGKEEIFF